MAATAVSAAELTIDGDTLQWWEIPDEAAYGFCNQCGSTVLWRPADGDHISIAAGTLDPPTGLTTAGAIFADEASDYHRLDDQIPQKAGDGTL